MSWNCDQISSVTCGRTGCSRASRRSSAASAVAIAARVVGVEPRLDRLGVPVAEVVEGEVVERVGDVGEVEPRQELLDLGPRLVDPRDDPRLLERRGVELGLDALGLLEDQPRDVPELVRELAALLDRAPAEADVLGRGDLQEAVAGRVGAVLARPPRAGRCRCRGSSTSGDRRSRAPSRLMITSVNGHVAEQEETGEDHPVLPEADDLAGGDVDVRPGSSARARASAPASRASRTARAPRRTTCRGRRSRARARSSRTRRSRRAAARPRSWWPSAQVQIGIWWPHQSWRETHQSGACSSDSIANRCWLSGWKRTRRASSASIAGPCELVHPAPPLRRDERLDPGVAALARPDRMAVVLALLEPVVPGEPVEDHLVGLLLGQALESPRPSCDRRGRSR